MQLVDTRPSRYRTTSDNAVYRPRKYQTSNSKDVDSELNDSSSVDSAVATGSESLGSSESINCLETTPKRNVLPPRKKNNRRHRRWCQLKQTSSDSCQSTDSWDSRKSILGDGAPVPTAVVRNTLQCPMVFPPGCFPSPYFLPHLPPPFPWAMQPPPWTTGPRDKRPVTVDLTGHDISYSVERLPPVNRGRRLPPISSRTSSPRRDDWPAPQFTMPPMWPPFPPSVYIPAPLQLPRAFDHCKSLKTCAVPFNEFPQYVNSTPPQRQWRQLNTPSKDGCRFTVMCYNVLSANYATHSQYPYCPTWAIDWEYRRRGILEELRHYAPNLICLQEIDTDQFESVFVPELAKLGYEGVFLAKSRSRTMDPSSARKVDGCAIFWLSEKFTKVAEFHHEFMLSCSSVSEHPSALLLNRVMTRDNVAIGVVLSIKGAPEAGGGRRFCVSTGHIHWDPEHSDVKLIQTIMWTAELWSHLEQLCGPEEGGAGTGSKGNASRMPVVFCGDFNSLPSSGVVEFLSRGCVPKSHVEFLNYGFNYQFEDWKMLEKWAVDGDILRHRFNFDRAYQAGDGDGMKITNLTYDFKGMIDYIFFTRQHFRILGSLDQIPESWFLEERILGCPHIHVPSDHFPLLVELDLLAQPVPARGLAISEPDGPAPASPKSTPKGGSSSSRQKQGGGKR